MKLVAKFLRKIVYPLLAYITRRWSIFYYNKKCPKIKQSVLKKDRIKVVFFPINIGMWKNDYLFQKLLNDPRFDPYVVSFFVPVDSLDFQRRNQDEMRSYFKNKGYPYFDMYNFETGEWFDIKSFQPDIVFYTQAVNVAYKKYRIQALWNSSLFYYIPYCLLMENETKTDNTLLFNICLKVFAPSEFHKEYWSSFINKGKNVVVTGYPSFDYLTTPLSISCTKWKCNDYRKRVIWAPHHSITSQDELTYSNFLEIAEQMISLAQEFRDSIEFVFKPHPRLRPKLEQLDEWGIEKTNSYYEKWEEMPNTNFVDGDYFDLFLTSDAMIHDCSTFMAEYLLTYKPVMFVLRDESSLDLNEYGRNCLKQHYIGHNFQCIRNFLCEVVLEGRDEMKNQRSEFVNRELKANRQEMVSEAIYREIKKDFS